MSSQDFSSEKLRENFLDFFKARGHKVIPSSSLVPEDDPTVLFTTAGMQQFKRFYLFPDEAPSARTATCQKCLRTGDIDEVGDETHLTFFEMLGNFSFGYPKKEHSYFKEEAIKMAWEFLTIELGLDKKRLSATYFAGDRGIPADEESRDLLKKITKLEDSKILGTDFSETFWSLGTEGSPGGPTVEFYVYPERSRGVDGLPSEASAKDGIEVWNLVFNEYKFAGGEYIESDSKGVDTGMGLERLTAVMQEESDIYKTDIFEPMIKRIEELSGKKYSENEKDFRIIADHMRAATALIANDIVPSNKDRGYVLRRLIRRAVVKGRIVGIKDSFCGRLTKLDKIKKILDAEEMKFRKTLDGGLKILSSAQRVGCHMLFDLLQTYGLPYDVSIEEAKRLNIAIENPKKIRADFDNLFREHQEKSRTASAGMFKGGLADNKAETTRLHTAAHLLLAALRQVLGDQVQQKGSNITEERLRFDFNYPEKLTPEQISKIEKIVNEKIEENLPVVMEEMSVDEAKGLGATGVFDDRYGDRVKVYGVGDFSKEICGGPHVKSTGELGHFKIIKEQSSSAGIRRIKATLS